MPEKKKKFVYLSALALVLLSSTPLPAEPRSGGAYYAYGEVLQKAILFYKAQRSGGLPGNYILPYRADSCMNDGADVGLDLTGGWYDAGDHVKFGFPMAYSACQLAWGVYEYREAFAQAGLLAEILDEIKWATDYFMKCHPEPDVYYYDCGYGESDHSCWVPPEGVLNEYFVRGWIQWEGPRDCDVLFQLNNRSASPPVVTSHMSARYFLDLSEVFAAGFTAHDVQVKWSSGDAGAVVSGLRQWAGDVYYFELSFPGVKIHPGHWDLTEKESIVRITHPIDNATANDYSYQGLSVNPDYNARLFTGMTDRIPIYNAGRLLWGVEPPDGGTATPRPTTAGLLGDVNGSGVVDIVDALLITQSYVGLNPAGFNSALADVNGSGGIDIIDALMVARYYVGLLSGF